MGKAALSVKDEDFVEHLLIANTHDTLLCFTNLGKVYWLKVYQIPVAGRASRGGRWSTCCSSTRASV
jgi:DNA gyrase subunit A